MDHGWLDWWSRRCKTIVLYNFKNRTHGFVWNLLGLGKYWGFFPNSEDLGYILLILENAKIREKVYLLLSLSLFKKREGFQYLELIIYFLLKYIASEEVRNTHLVLVKKNSISLISLPNTWKSLLFFYEQKLSSTYSF